MLNDEDCGYRCFNCKKEYDNFNPPTFEDREIDTGDEKLLLHISICPFCYAEKLVQIDNEETLRLFYEEARLGSALINTEFLHGSKSDKFKKQYREFKRISTVLTQARQKLDLKYADSVYYFGNENKKIKFNVPVVK